MCPFRRPREVEKNPFLAVWVSTRGLGSLDWALCSGGPTWHTALGLCCWVWYSVRSTGAAQWGSIQNRVWGCGAEPDSTHWLWGYVLVMTLFIASGTTCWIQGNVLGRLSMPALAVDQPHVLSWSSVWLERGALLWKLGSGGEEGGSSGDISCPSSQSNSN